MADEGDRVLYLLVWAALAITTLVIHILIDDEIAFADAASYLYYVDNLYFYRLPDWFIFEPISKTILLFLREVTGDTVLTVSFAHYLIGFVYLFGTLALFPPSKGNWRGLLMAFALYGPQLAFVTIRATPAYMIASVAVLQAIRGNNRAFLMVAIATLFHISSVIALLPILTIFFKSKLRFLQALQRPKVLTALFIVLIAAFALGGSLVFEAIRSVFENIPFLGKYLVFTVGMSDSGGLGNLVSEFAIGHFILLFAISGFTMLFFLINDMQTRSIAIFVVVSYLLYSFTFFAFSPIAAFRQTPFWVLPAFSIFPWQRIGWRGVGQPIYLAIVATIFAFQFSRVI